MTLRILKALFILIAIFVWSHETSGASLKSFIPRKDLPEGWALLDGPHLYNRKSLFGHINGQAELFIKYGFQKSIFGIYQNRKNKESQVEIDIYDMGNVLQAFGVFSRFRTEDRPGGVGLESYFEDQTGLFYKGKYFIMLYASEPNPGLLREWALLVSKKIADHSPPPREIGFFPREGLKPGSLQYFQEGLLGYPFLKRGFQGTYSSKEKAEPEVKPYHLFLVIFRTPQEAMEGMKAYREDLSQKGRMVSGTFFRSGSRGLKGEDPSQGKVIVLQKGLYLLGAVGFEKEEDAEDRLVEFMKSIK